MALSNYLISPRPAIGKLLVALRKFNFMKKINIAIVALSLSGLMMASCNGGKPADNRSTQDSVKPMPPVALAKVSTSPDFPDASLAIKGVKAEKVGKDSAKVSFEFLVKNYELKAQTADNGSKVCNNSDKGQHIHFILDNAPYKALYEPTNDVTLANGTEHYLMAFLSRSYHESIKAPKAAVVYHFKIDEKGNLKKLDDPKTPMVFYSRPKGDYMGKDTTNVMLDFYVWNGTLSDSLKVKADIVNETYPDRKLTTTIDKWESNFIQNLGTGKCKVSLSLVDKDGKTIEGPQTGTSREFNLTAGEGVKK